MLYITEPVTTDATEAAIIALDQPADSERELDDSTE